MSLEAARSGWTGERTGFVQPCAVLPSESFGDAYLACINVAGTRVPSIGVGLGFVFYRAGVVCGV